jgi:hypothetical protein
MPRNDTRCKQLLECVPALIIAPLEIVHLLGAAAFIWKLPVVVIRESGPKVDLLPLVIDNVLAVTLILSFAIASLSV